MSNTYPNQHGTQIKDPSVMIGAGSFHSQNEWLSWILRILAIPIWGTLIRNKKISSERYHNKNLIHCYFKNQSFAKKKNDQNMYKIHEI